MVKVSETNPVKLCGTEQSQLDQVNAVFSDGEKTVAETNEPIKKFRVELGPTLAETSIPTFQLSKDLTVLQVRAPLSHLQEPEKVLVLLSQLGKALEYPMHVFTKYNRNGTRPPITELLQLAKTETSYNTFFHLVELNAENSMDPKIQTRLEMAYLLALEHAGETLPKNFKVEEAWLRTFPGTPVDFAKVQTNGQSAKSLILEKYGKKPWSKLDRFFSALGSKELQQMAEQGERKKVAQYLEGFLPVEMLTDHEITFWRNQLAAMEAPDKNKLVYLFRGGEFTLGKGRGYFSRSLQTETQRASYPKLATLAAALTKVSVLNTLYSHSEFTSATFISTTTDPDVASQFSKRSGIMVTVAVDSRRTLPGSFSRWGESEILVPWILFPDEIVASTDKMSESQMRKKFWGKVGIPVKCQVLFLGK